MRDLSSADATCRRCPALPLLALLLALPLLAASCRQGEAPAAAEATEAAAQSQSGTTGQQETTTLVRPIVVPDGTPEELFAFIDQLDAQLTVESAAGEADIAGGQAPAGISAEASQAIALRRVMEARVAATDKILARQVPEQTRLRAITIQLDALRTLVGLDPEGMAERFDRYTLRIAESHDPLLRRMALATRFQADATRSLSADEPSGEQLMVQLQTLLDDPDAGPETLNATVQAGEWLANAGDRATAAEAFRRIGRRFVEYPDSSVAELAQSLINQSTNLELMELAAAVIENRPDAKEKLVTKMEQLLAAPEEDPNRLAYAMQTALLLELTGHPSEALKTYRLIGSRFEDNTDSTQAQSVRQSVALAERRLNLIGQPLTIEGVHLSGKTFDWEAYRGKWVLVCFWAAWHQQWPIEVGNLRKAIETYRDVPISVVSISLDDDRNLLERYLKENPVSWPVLVSADPTSSGSQNPTAVHCGVEAVPFVLLVGADGHVADIHLMGERLFSSLAEHLGQR